MNHGDSKMLYSDSTPLKGGAALVRIWRVGISSTRVLESWH